MRAAIYARFSTDLQSAASIDDQVRLCRERIEQDGYRAVEVYADRAISGASRVPGIQSLMADAAKGRFDFVYAEALDRISRDQQDPVWRHARKHTSHRNHFRSLYWRSKARSPHWASVAAVSPGHMSGSGACRARGLVV